MYDAHDYPLGYSDQEARRLAELGAQLEIPTQDMLRRAGLQHGARVLDDSPQERIGGGFGSARLHRDGDLLADARELLGHPVPAGEHRVFSSFEDASHGGESSLSVAAE